MSNLIKKESFVQRNERMKKEKLTAIRQFARWFMQASKKGIVSHGQCAKAIHSIRPEADITMRTVNTYIIETRKILEKHYGKSIWNVRGEGWRVASEKEKAVHLVRCARTTVNMAERTNRLYAITKRKLIPAAVVEVFGSKKAANLQVSLYKSKLDMVFGKSRRMLTHV